MITILRALSQATQCLTARASGWVVLRQQRWLNRLSVKRRSQLYSSFYLPVDTETDTADTIKRQNSLPNFGRPHYRASLLKRHQFIPFQRNSGECTLVVIVKGVMYELSFNIDEANADEIKLEDIGKITIRQLPSKSKCCGKRSLDGSKESVYSMRKRVRSKKFASRNSGLGNTVAPIVPPRTKSAQLQKPSAFHLQPIRNVSATRTLLTKEPNGISSASTLHQSTPLPQPPNQSSTTSGAKKTISHPILNSSTVTSIQQPLQLINISALASKGNIHSCSSGPGKHSEISSSLPKVRTLDLGGGKSVPMNSLYESLLHENYFHPVIRNALPKLLTKDRMFLVRPSTHSQHPVTLSLQEHDKIFNISIRVRKDGKYSLGTEKPGEMSFISVGEMIGWYEREPIKLVDGSLTYLSWSPPKTLKNIMR